ncbi:Dolichyl-P-Man:Man(7)GlcNAc(2)-PP-dolichol alpha-1,6-mannosyltransferase protein [Dioscorea alata]|uniref:Dolichyl-P-Man:Man(7)GlcNAc(2)-PP-dolichol alpha-1,6-mannosyltransferase protein n=3 Tax=Dioscorea alata TaxID=55571 RepID=A0ACB7UG19_DIOAL|nr:Dolichyl-P-Man:Man(7)GlcNAc(2)-PP-dolichol alpha-1,6-mannosyltransferase protein [Dioscorea alata]KAH7659254.1 Dolichyl-P-Man:Man(7)GlcNAc(2)-PP-dolichol alpha-1,6-mannosyltransferase protein [Dioscorea alata]KAH7659255.1 Dolichyl-P-Man:Man(7)GlcNAc(2)-PP-dolichol alpha-1,6-mannosyltransferase protein [Dioscorea alata]
MATRRKPQQESKGWLSKFVQEFGWDVLLGSIAAFYVFMVPYTKVEESFNVQAMHDILYHRHHIGKYDHLDFPGVVPRTFIGALLVSILASPVVLVLHLLHAPKFYSLYAVRLVLGCITLSSLRSLRIEIRRKFGYHVEAFFVILTSVQFHLLFYSTRPLPNIFAFCLVTLAYSSWFRGDALSTLKCLTIATAVFRCDTVLLFGTIGISLLLSKSVSMKEAIKCCISTAFLCIGLTILVDTIMWGRVLWPELEVFWFNSVLNRSSEWGTHAFHWYFTSALPRSLLVAYPLFMLALLLDRRLWQYIVPVFSFVLIYSKLPHKELRFIIGAVPIFNVAAAITASRVYNNRKKTLWRWIYIGMLVSILISLGCSIVTFMASYENYPGGYALKALHQAVETMNTTMDRRVHIDPFAAMNGVSRFLENNPPWSYSKEEGITLAEYHTRNFTYLLSEHSKIDGFQCLFFVDGFSKSRLQIGFPPIILLRDPKVFVHGNIGHEDIALSNWPGCL